MLSVSRELVVVSNIINIERIIHSIKTAIAVLLGFALTKLVGLPADQWVVITIIVVMCAQIYVGSVMQKAYLRFLGTLVGCLFAAFTIIAFGTNNFAIAATIGLSSLIFSYVATGKEDFTYAGTLGAVTTTIIMLGQKPTLIFALERFLEISIGILIATLVSQFVLPIHARIHLRRAQAHTLGKLRDYYATTITAPTSKIEELNSHELDESIVKSLLKQRQLAKESVREPLGTSFDPGHFMQSLYCEREILRAITFMHNALSHIQNAEQIFVKSAAAHTFNETIMHSLDTLIHAINTDEPSKDHIHIPSLSGIKEELQKNLQTSTREELIFVDGFLFCAEILTNSLRKLAMLYQVPVWGQVDG